MGSLRVTRTHNGGRTESHAYDTTADSFNEATDTLVRWLWLNATLAMTQHVVKVWMRGERYADHSVCVRYYVPGTVGHWYDIMYRA